MARAKYTGGDFYEWLCGQRLLRRVQRAHCPTLPFRLVTQTLLQVYTGALGPRSGNNSAVLLEGDWSSALYPVIRPTLLNRSTGAFTLLSNYSASPNALVTP
jgi:hypothetical protein